MNRLRTKFYIEALEKHHDKMIVTGNEAKHMKVLRAEIGDLFFATNGKGYNFNCKIKNIENGRIHIKILDVEKTSRYPLKINILFGVTKRKKWEWLIEKGTEIGVLEFTPLITRRNRQYSKGIYKKKNLKRCRKKAVAALKQSERNIIPKINQPLDIKNIENQKDYLKNLFLLDIKGEKFNKKELDKIDKLNIIIGPEGGFTKNEKEKLKKLKAKNKSIGDYILKTETAALKAASILTYLQGDF